MQFITSHITEILGIGWACSELLGEIPSVKANSVFGIFKSMLSAFLGKK